MKKIFAMALALVMTFSLSVNALAVEPDELTTTEAPYNVSTGTVTVTVNEGVDAGIVYSVTVEWTDTEVIYQKAGEGRWNPETHAYDNATQDGWTNNTAAVKVTNHSNAAVDAVVENSVNNTGVSYELDPAEFNLATAENTEVEEAPSQTVTITAEGTPTAGTDKFTVTITAAAVAEPETIELTFKDVTTLSGKGSSVTILLPDGYTNENTTYTLSEPGGATCNMSVAAGTNSNELVVSHGPGICGGMSSGTLTVVSKADPSITGSIVIESSC